MNKFTAGPWVIDDFDISSKEDPANLIASLYPVEKDERGGYYLGEEFKANAKLIAAAPDLLEALQKIQFRCECFLEDDRDMKKHSIEAIKGICDRAIAKALAPQS